MNDSDNLYKLIDKYLENTKIRDFSKGEMVEGVIEKLSSSFMLVKVDDVFDVIVPASEMLNNVEQKVGDKVRIFILKTEDDYGVITASQIRTTPSQRWILLEEALKTGEIVTVEVIEANNGGVLVTIDGVMGFIPTSQLDPNRLYKISGDSEFSKDFIVSSEITKKLVELIGTKIKVRVTEIDKEKGRVIFSEKFVMSDFSPLPKNEILKKVKVGDVLEGVVTAVTDYGIFVNAQGLDGLVHVSEISWDKVENPLNYAKVGDKLKVVVIDIAEGGKRIAYSIKQLTNDPWHTFVSDYKIGSKVKGVITDIEDYGLIVKIDSGITGLIHRSEISDDFIGDLTDLFQKGQEVEAIILTISPSERRMGLSIKRLNPISSDKSKRINKLKKAQEKIRKIAKHKMDLEGVLKKAKSTVEKN